MNINLHCPNNDNIVARVLGFHQGNQDRRESNEEASRTTSLCGRRLLRATKCAQSVVLETYHALVDKCNASRGTTTAVTIFDGKDSSQSSATIQELMERIQVLAADREDLQCILRETQSQLAGALKEKAELQTELKQALSILAAKQVGEAVSETIDSCDIVDNAESTPVAVLVENGIFDQHQPEGEMCLARPLYTEAPCSLLPVSYTIRQMQITCIDTQEPPQWLFIEDAVEALPKEDELPVVSLGTADASHEEPSLPSCVSQTHMLPEAHVVQILDNEGHPQGDDDSLFATSKESHQTGTRHDLEPSTRDQ